MHGILRELVEVFGASGAYVSLAQRNGPGGYVYVVPAGLDPARRASRHLLVELQNGTVGVTDQLREALGARPRTKVRIEQDPLGFSAGPRYGRFKWGITHDDIVARWGSERAFVEEASKLLRALTPASDDGDDGDYG